MTHRNHYWLVGVIGIGLAVVISTLVLHSLSDWDFYYRIASGMIGPESVGLNFEGGPEFTRFVASNRWFLFMPVAVLAGALIVGRGESTVVAGMLSCSAIVSILAIGYLTAYLPVAKPGWWGDGRPMYLIDGSKGNRPTKPEQYRAPDHSHGPSF